MDLDFPAQKSVLRLRNPGVELRCSRVKIRVADGKVRWTMVSVHEKYPVKGIFSFQDLAS